MKLRTKIFIPVFVLIAVVTVSLLLGANYILAEFISPVVPEYSRDSQYYIFQQTQSEAPADELSQCYSWLKENSKVFSILSFDNIYLNGYFAAAENESHNYGIFFHGYKSEPREMSFLAKNFHEKNFNVLVPGLRGHGWSDGKCMDMGFYSKNDVLSWCSFLTERDSNAKIFLFGVSMGAAGIICAGSELPENVVCVIADSCYTSAWNQFVFKMKSEYNLGPFPVLTVASKFSKNKFGFEFSEASPLTDIAFLKVPVLFIHSKNNSRVPFEMLDELYFATKCKKKKLELEDEPGEKISGESFKTYMKTINSFTDSFFNEQESSK